jgi:uncharacterized membrane protein YraQ (UPF0718 family)
MRLAMGILALMLGGVMIYAAIRGDGSLQNGFKESLVQGKRIIPVLILAVFIMGFMEALLPKAFVENWLSESAGFKGMALAWLAGALTPAGSVIGMPIAAGLYKAGANIGIIITYLASMALLSVIRIPLEIGFYGPKLMVMRIAACLVLPPIAGYIAIFFQKVIKG